jgi:hypothetical protein
MRRDFFRGKFPRHIANRNLVLVEGKVHDLSISHDLFRKTGSHFSGSCADTEQKNPHGSPCGFFVQCDG